jgi:tetratricopeptide (TPR) repeat protein
MAGISRKLLVFFAMCVMCLVTGSSSACPKGDDLRDHNRLHEATEAYLACAQQHPFHPGVLHNLGVCLIETGKHTQAVPYLQRALSSAPTVSQTHAALSQALLAVGRCPEALHALSEAVHVASSTASSGINNNAHAMATWLLDTVAKCPWALSQPMSTSDHPKQPVQDKVSGHSHAAPKDLMMGESVLGAAIGWQKNVARYDVWMRAGEYAINTDACTWALRAFATAERLHAETPVSQSQKKQKANPTPNNTASTHIHGEQARVMDAVKGSDDALFGAAICLQRQGKERAAWQTYIRAAHKRGVRRHLSLMGAYMAMLRSGDWSKPGHNTTHMTRETAPSLERDALFSHGNVTLSHRVRNTLIHEIHTQYIPGILGEKWREYFAGNQQHERSRKRLQFQLDNAYKHSLLQPHEALALHVPIETLHAITYIYAHAHSNGPKNKSPYGEKKMGKTNRVLNVGYASSDLNAHATSHLLKGAFAMHDASRVRPYCFALCDQDAGSVKESEDITGGVLGDGNKEPRGVHINGNEKIRDWEDVIAQSCEIVRIYPDQNSVVGARAVEHRHVDILCELHACMHVCQPCVCMHACVLALCLHAFFRGVCVCI